MIYTPCALCGSPALPSFLFVQCTRVGCLNYLQPKHTTVPIPPGSWQWACQEYDLGYVLCYYQPCALNVTCPVSPYAIHQADSEALSLTWYYLWLSDSLELQDPRVTAALQPGSYTWALNQYARGKRLGFKDPDNATPNTLFVHAPTRHFGLKVHTVVWQVVP